MKSSSPTWRDLLTRLAAWWALRRVQYVECADCRDVLRARTKKERDYLSVYERCEECAARASQRDEHRQKMLGNGLADLMYQQAQYGAWLGSYGLMQAQHDPRQQRNLSSQQQQLLGGLLANRQWPLT